MSGLIAIDTNPGFTPKESLSQPDRLISSASAFKSWAQDSSKAEQVLTGVWEATPGETHSTKGTTFEFCHILPGLVEIEEEEEGGETRAFRAGDSFVMKPGYVDIWCTIETVPKIFVSTNDRVASSTAQNEMPDPSGTTVNPAVGTQGFDGFPAHVRSSSRLGGSSSWLIPLSWS